MRASVVLSDAAYIRPRSMFTSLSTRRTLPGPVTAESLTTASEFTRFSCALVMEAHPDMYIIRKNMVHHRAMALSTRMHSLMTVSVMSSDLGILFILVTSARSSLACRLMLPALSRNLSTRPVSTFTMALRSASRRVTHACSIVSLSFWDNCGSIRPASALASAWAISSSRKQELSFI